MGMGNKKDPYKEMLRKERNKKARATYQKKKAKKESDDFITAVVMLPVNLALAPVKAIVEVNKAEKAKKARAKKAAAAKKAKKR